MNKKTLTLVALNQALSPDTLLVTLHQKINLAEQHEDGSGRIQIFPDGRFYAKDNRNPAGWELTKEAADALIATAQSRKDDYLIDYEHQAVLSAQNGKPVPAAGWFKNIDYIEGQGLFADVNPWTMSARTAIKNDEYRYISPTFITNQKGEILSLFNVALTNTPAIDGMATVMALSEMQSMQLERSDFLEELKRVLGVASDLSDDQLIGAVKEMINQVSYLKAQAPDSASTNPDPAKFVPIELFTDVNSRLAKIESDHSKKEIDTVIEGALSEGKINPAQKAWALDYCKSNLDGFKQYLSIAQPVVTLGKTQTGGIPPVDSTVTLSETELKIQELTGISLEKVPS